MFERQCTLLEKVGNIENSLGQVDLRILYDDDVFGARIVAYSGIYYHFSIYPHHIIIFIIINEFHNVSNYKINFFRK